jgi:hypothetical protein
MTLILELTPELEQQLRQEAAQRGQALEEYAITRLQKPQQIPSETRSYETRTPMERAEAYLAWAQSHENKMSPPIPAEALRRENLYED